MKEKSGFGEEYINQWLRQEVTYRSEYYKPIDELDLSVRSYNCLRRSGIECFGQLEKMTLSDLMHIRNIGKRSAEEIALKAKEHGIRMNNCSFNGTI